MLRCELHRLAGDDALWRAWKDLLTRVRPELRLFGPEWYSAWNETIGSQEPWTGAFDVVAVYQEDSGQLLGVMPVGHPKVGLLRVNALGGYYQPWRLILADQTCEHEVGRALGWFMIELGWSVIQLGPWPMSHAAHRGVLSALSELDMPMQKQKSCELAVADMPATWEAYQRDVLGAKFLRRLRNYESKLQRNHRIQIQHIQHPDELEASKLLAALGHIERRSWLAKARNGRLRFASDIDQQFWRKLTQQSLVPNGQLDCWLMSADEIPISFVFSLTAVSTRYVIANQYDEDFAEYRTGSLLYLRMFEDGFARGVTRYDFGTNELHYKQQWGAQYVDRVETFTVATNRLVAGIWRAGIAIKGLFDGTLWGRPNFERATDQQLAPDAAAAETPISAVVDDAAELVEV